MTVRMLSTFYPVHESAIQKRRLKQGAELRTVKVVLGGRKKSLDIFFVRGYNLSGRDSIRVLFGKKYQTLKLVLPKKVEKAPEIQKDLVLKGIAASPGIEIGSPLLWRSWEKGLPIKKYGISEKGMPREIGRFRGGLAKAKEYYQGLIAEAVSDNARRMFETHILMLESIAEKVEAGIKEKKLNAEYILEDEISKHVGVFDKMDDPYLKERGADVKNAGRVLLEQLSGVTCRRKIKGEEVILVAEEILASDMGEIMRAKAKVLAFITETGGPTSHAAILAKEMGIPAVLGIENAMEIIRDSDQVAVNGRSGEVAINPSEERLGNYRKRKESYDVYIQKLLHAVRGKPAETKDGHRVSLGANIMSAREFEAATAFEIDEIGLLRTESLFMGRDTIPTEKEHYETYRALRNIPVKIRTFDLGGDKFTGKKAPKEMHLPPESRSFLGLRGIRLYAHNEFWGDMFRVQIRGILRASAKNEGLSIMFPMVSRLYEFRWAKGIVEEEKQKLKEKDIQFNDKIKVGIMAEVPSVISFADQLAKEVDYFSFGSNDMIQYMFGVGRGNPAVAYLYDPFHFSIIWSLKRIIDAAHHEKKPVYLCGDMGADPLAAFLLVGLGIDGISMVASDVPKIKYLLQVLEKKQAEEFTAKILKEFYSVTATTRHMPIREQLKKLIQEDFFLDVIRRIDLIEEKLSPSRSI